MEAHKGLFTLPDELLLEILSYSSPTSRVTQQLTCRRLQELVKDVPFPRQTPRCLDLLLLEQLLPKPCLYVCTHCLRPRSRSAFILSQTRDYSKGYWSIASLLEIESQGARRTKDRFLFNRRAPPVEPGTRRMMAASIEAGLRSQRLAADLASADTHPDLSPDAEASHLTSTGHPSLPPSSPRANASNTYSTPMTVKPPGSERICIDCGVKKHVWSQNYMLRYPLDDEAKDIGTGIICRRCNRFARCAPDSKAMLNKTCEMCMQYRVRGARSVR